MIKKFISNRKRVGWKYDPRQGKFYSWGFDIRLPDGRRKREPGFLNKADAEAAVARIRLVEKEARYGFTAPEPVALSDVCAKKVEQTANRREKVRAERVLKYLVEELPANFSVTNLLTSHLQNVVERRTRDGLKPQSIDRELNIISAALQAAPDYFPALKNWTVPKIPRPKHKKARRERVITLEELTRILTWLYSPKRDEETEQRAHDRRTVGHVFRVALLTGARKGELCQLRWDHVDWGAKELQIVGTKTDRRSAQVVRYLLITDTVAEILRERQKVTKGAFVFTRAGGRGHGLLRDPT